MSSTICFVGAPLLQKWNLVLFSFSGLNLSRQPKLVSSGTFLPSVLASSVADYSQPLYIPNEVLTTEYAGDDDDDDDNDEAQLLDALRHRRTEEGWQLFRNLRNKGKVPNRVCCSRLVAQLAHQCTASSIARAQRVVLELENESQLDLLDCDSLGLLVMATARLGAARYGLGILRIMLKHGHYPSVKVWSSAVSKLSLQLDDIPVALEAFDEMCNFFLDATGRNHISNCPTNGTLYTYKYSQEGSATYGSNPMVMKPDTGAFNAVLNACANAGLLQRAEEIIGKMPSFGVAPDTKTFNIMIKLYGRVEKIPSICTLLQNMEEAGVEPNMATFNSLVAAHVGLGDIKTAEMIVKSLQEGRLVEYFRSEYTSSEQNPIDRAALDNNKQRNPDKWLKFFKPDVRMYSTLMKGYVQKGRLGDAMQILYAMQNPKNSDTAPNEVTFTTAIRACIAMGLMDEACEIMKEMARRNVPANVITYNTLLQGYCSAQDMNKAESLFNDMKEAGISPDVVSFNTIINGFIQYDDNVSALAYFRDMRKAGIYPSKVSYSVLMKAFSKNEQPKLVERVFHEMQLDPRVKVDLVAWNTLIDSYCRVGLVDDAKRVLKNMKLQGFQPTVATYGTLAKGFSRVGQPGEVLLLWKEIKDRYNIINSKPIRPDEPLFDTLVDVFVRAGYFQRALEVVECMERDGIATDKTKYKRLVVELYSNLYTSKHVSQSRRDRSAPRRRAFEAFKFWLGLPNKYYDVDW